jgi:solute carrier family 25 carnitine/acylcarnitine transporter 20/29
MYFGVYEKMIGYFKKDGQVSLGGSLFSGGMSGLACWSAIYPVDYVKTLIQTDSLENPRYKSSFGCMMEEFRTKPITSFFRGV